MPSTATSHPPARGALLALIAGAVAIGFAPVFVRWSPVGPVSTAFWRLLLSLPVLFVWAAIDRRRATGAGTPQAGGWLLAAGLAFAGDLALWHWSIRLTSVANATLLANCASVFVVLFGIVMGRRVSRGFLGAMACGLTGTVLLMGAHLGTEVNALRGNLLGLLTAVFYAAYLLCVAHLRQRTPTGILMAGSSLAATVALLPIALLSGENVWPADGRGWPVLFALAWLSHAAGQGLSAYALAHLPAAFSSVALLVQPMTAALAGGLLLGEHPGPWQIVGGVLVLAGVLAARRASG